MQVTFVALEGSVKWGSDQIIRVLSRQVISRRGVPHVLNSDHSHPATKALLT